MSKIKLPVPLPVQQYARCVDAQGRPANHIGDWPECGQVYPIELRRNAHSGEMQVHVLGFYAERPYVAFARQRFVSVAQVWLN
ncbi:hypothetical protein CDA63_11365 [Hymenobacter amundsenii]|uniref:Uncharacterized protein n=1 Tax=Hymenobacter amundsenii TaxID=2006685 RepID=A0A246FK68_9BACT|nr:hypothetical protein [Hymenobacter amundsenii]OWP62976.1 hypothetical protein CDA63_11365 [Hymenobacter amundsenii]